MRHEVELEFAELTAGRLADVLAGLDGPQTVGAAMASAVLALTLHVPDGEYWMKGQTFEADAIVERATVTIIVRAL
jgi:hypothetical protein